MASTTLPNRRLLLTTLSLTYITIGMLGALPGASLIRLASNTHISLEVAGTMFTISAFGSMLGTALSGFLIRYSKPKYLLMLGLFLMGSGSTTISLTGSFPVLLLGQVMIGLGFGFIDPSLNTIATLTFQERLASVLNTFHGLYGLGSLLGPLVLAFGLHFFESLELSYLVGVGAAAITILLLLGQQVPEPARQATNVQQKQAANRDLQNVLRQGLLFAHAIGQVSSTLIISTNAASMIVPLAMGLLIPSLGINRVMAIPALCCAFAALPMALAARKIYQGS